jgi:hypothetical protein
LREFGPNSEQIGNQHRKQIEWLAGRLLDSDVREALLGLRRVHRGLLAGDGAEAADAARVVVDIARHITPAIYDFGVVHWTAEQQAAGVALVRLPACIKTVAEIVMAGIDGREVRLRPRETEDDLPEGELSLPLSPEQGMAAGAAEAARALQTHLARKFGSEYFAMLRNKVDDYLLRYFSRPARGAPERSDQERIKLTARVIDARRRDGDPSFYMMFYPPEDEAGRKEMEDMASELKRDYPALMFLALDPSYEQELWDQDLVDPLCRMLPLRDPAAPTGSDQDHRRGDISQ